MQRYTRALRFALPFLAVVVFLAVPLFAAGATPTDLPPRPTVTPTVTPAPAPDEPRAGATIELRAPGMPTTTWTVVQWQDAEGGWHDVEGWQGHLDDGVKRWWVAPADFRKGPFRWVLYETADGDLLSTSDPFDLPLSPHEIVVVPVR